MGVAFALLFKPQMGFGTLGAPIHSRGTAAAYTGLALTIAGVLLARIRPLVSRRELERESSPSKKTISSFAADRTPSFGTPFIRPPAWDTRNCRRIRRVALPRRAAPRDSGIPAESRLEEQFLVQQFGSEYERYRTSVKALIPFVL